MKKIIYFLLIVVCSVCLWLFLGKKDKKKIARHVMRELARELKEEEGLRVICKGALVDKKIQTLNIGFDCFHTVSLQEAQMLFTSIAKKYLNVLNRDPKVKSCFSPDLLTGRDLEIRVWFYHPDGSAPLSSEICYVKAMKGELIYWINHPQTGSSSILCRKPCEVFNSLQKL